MFLLSDSQEVKELKATLGKKFDTTVAIKLCGKAAFDKIQMVLSSRGESVIISSWEQVDGDGALQGMQISSSGRPKGILEDCTIAKALSRYHSTASSTAAITASLHGSFQESEDEDISQRQTSSPARFSDLVEAKGKCTSSGRCQIVLIAQLLHAVKALTSEQQTFPSPEGKVERKGSKEQACKESSVKTTCEDVVTSRNKKAQGGVTGTNGVPSTLEPQVRELTLTS